MVRQSARLVASYAKSLDSVPGPAAEINRTRDLSSPSCAFSERIYQILQDRQTPRGDLAGGLMRILSSLSKPLCHNPLPPVRKGRQSSKAAKLRQAAVQLAGEAPWVRVRAGFRRPIFLVFSRRSKFATTGNSPAHLRTVRRWAGPRICEPFTDSRRLPQKLHS